MHRSITATAAAIAATVTLAGAASANASTGHGCQFNGAAAGCPAAANIPAGSDLIFTDPSIAAADDFQFVGAANAVRCRDATAKGVLTSAGGPAYPIGGTGPTGYIPGASITGPLGTACSATIGGIGSTGSVTLLDSNGALPGLVNFQGDWTGAGALPKLVLRAPVFLVREILPTGAPIDCKYRGEAFTAAVTNSALGLVKFVGQPVVKLSGPAPCPTTATISVPFNVRWAFGGGTGPFRISA